MPTIAVVTGSNKGIGYAILRVLAKQINGGVVYLTARNPKLGEEAVDSLKSELGAQAKSEIRFHQLDLNDQNSINKLRDDLKSEHGGLDILVNNAGIAYEEDKTTLPISEQAELTMKTNYYGTRNISRAMTPILRQHARMVIMSSKAGLLKRLSSEDLKHTFSSDSLTMDQLDALIQEYLQLAKTGDPQSKGYSKHPYAMSKVAETALTRVLQREVDQIRPGEDIVVTCCCPGYVSTDLNSHRGTSTVEEGADTPAFLAQLPPNWDSGRGLFFHKRELCDWYSP